MLKMPPQPSSVLPYTKTTKLNKPTHYHHPLHQPRTQHGYLCSLFSFAFFLIGLICLVSSFSTSRSPPRTVTVYKCDRSEDTLRSFVESRSGGGDETKVKKKDKLLGIVGIQTGFASFERRMALRSTWFPSDPDGLVNLERSTGLAFRFVIGRTTNATRMAELKKEEEKYHDFMLIDVEEETIKPPYKTLAFLKAAFILFEAEFYVKADDNIYMRPDRLATLLARDRAHRLTYIGCMKKGPVVTDPKQKWYESLGHLIGNEYFLHAYGPIYALSTDVVATLATAKNDSLRMFNNEDVTVGAWVLSMNVHYEDSRALCHTKCTASSVAVWDMPRCSGLCDPVDKMKELHNITVCSKSPTLPPEELE